MAKTLTEMIELAKQKADLENNPHVSDTEWANYINYAVEELYDIVVSTNQDYFVVEDTSIVTTAGEAQYDLPNDFYKLISVNAKIFGNQYRNITRFNHSQRNRYSLSTNYFRYRLRGSSKIEFTPTPQANTEIKLEYIPNPPVLEDSADEWPMEQFVEYLVTNAAINALNKEESDTAQLERRLLKLEENVKRFVYRDDAEPDSVSDIWDNYAWDDWLWR